MNTELKTKLAEAYLDFVNNYNTTVAFGRAYGLTQLQADGVISLGRSCHESNVASREGAVFCPVCHDIRHESRPTCGTPGCPEGKPKPVTVKDFTVIAVSTNTNAFGYKSVLCLAADGEGFEGLVQAYGTDIVPSRGDTVHKDHPCWYGGPRALSSIPATNAVKVIAEAKKGGAA